MHSRLTFFKHILYFSPSFLASLFGILLRSNRLIDRGLALKIALCTMILYSASWTSALYALVPNCVLGQMLGCPAPVLAPLCSARSAKGAKGAPLRLCFRLVLSSASAEKAEN